MYQEFYKGHFLLNLPIFALFLFMTFFVLASWRAWTHGQKTGEDDRLAQLPFSDDDRPASLGGSHVAGETHV
jgi:hypothetical protein